VGKLLYSRDRCYVTEHAQHRRPIAFADDNDDEDGEDESSRPYHRTSALINATSILRTYEIGNPAGRNYSNNNLALCALALRRGADETG